MGITNGNDSVCLPKNKEITNGVLLIVKKDIQIGCHNQRNDTGPKIINNGTIQVCKLGIIQFGR